MNYIERLKIPINGNNDLIFYTKSNIMLAKGYIRIVIGERGPYIEFERKNFIDFSKLQIPESQKWRLKNNNSFYIEYRSKDYVKIYFQKRVVNYADYKIGKFYISPFDLYINNKEHIIDTLNKK
jgi:hypothetical protein